MSTASTPVNCVLLLIIGFDGVENDMTSELVRAVGYRVIAV